MQLAGYDGVELGPWGYFPTDAAVLKKELEARALTLVAVVADEVCNLASKSAQAAQSTTRLIAETVESVQKGSEIAKSTAMAMQESAQETQRAVTLIDKIAQASEQQAQSIAQINVGVEQIASVVQTNSATAQESAAASEELSGQAHTLKQLISHFQILEAQQLDNSAEVVLLETEESFLITPQKMGQI